MTTPYSAYKKKIHTCPVISNTNLVGEIYLMRLACPDISAFSLPGQFVNVKVNEEVIPLLRKPFSVCRRSSAEGWFEVLWKVVGKGTKIMADLRAGDSVSVVGPLGRGFRTAPKSGMALLVAGGIGVAPFPFLCEQLLAEGVEVEIFLGAQSTADLAMVDVFAEAGVPVTIATEDGSTGHRGLVTESLLKRLSSVADMAGVHLFSCGPTGFLKAMTAISEECKVEGQVAIETMMGCGFGICVGCPVRVRNPRAGEKLYKLSCIDGPVFGTREICLDG
ncbi:dihydroorotate dehydrogenase electron transfer subunit [candidate division KSB1 bacterium]|nr:dihydroorotate dehydrogenase electron transfer subunit [candidate division KSB1 bacterium]